MASLCSSSVHFRASLGLQRPQAAARSRLAPVAAAAVPAACARLQGSSSSLQGSQVLLAQQARRQPTGGRRQVSVQARRSSAGPDVADRVVAALPYIMPLLDGLRYGKFFLLQFPQAGAVLIPLDPIIRLYYSVPFAGLVVFFAIYLGIVNNFNFSRYVRFNAMQAILLDIILILPGLLESVFRGPPMGGAGLQLYISMYNTIFLFLAVCVMYGVGSCLAGQTARLPLVADAADQQVR